MEAQAQIIFKKIVRHLNSRGEIAEIEVYLNGLVEGFYNLYQQHILQWDTASSRTGHNSSSHTHTLVFNDYRLQLTYTYVCELGNFATVLISLIKNRKLADLSIRKALFLHNSKTQTLIQLDSEISRP